MQTYNKVKDELQDLEAKATTKQERSELAKALQQVDAEVTDKWPNLRARLLQILFTTKRKLWQ